ncbi:MAG: hypothetical protein JWP97_5191 [Labilithrix sp.]|nr:hypothetical protein [Labilithrix sp.]
MTRRSRTLELVAIIFAVALLTVVEVLGQHSTTELADTARSVQRSREVMGHLDALLVATLEAESSRRGFALTNEQVQLDPYRGAAGRAFGEIGQLQTLLADSPEQRRRLEELVPAVRERLDSLDRAVAIQQESGGIPREVELNGTRGGMRRMAAVRGAVEGMVTAEQQLLAQREQTTRASLRRARMIQLLGTVVSVSIFIAVLARLRAVARRLRASEAHAKNNEEDLATTIHSIGDGVIATDGDGLVTRMNSVAEALTGWRLADALGKPAREVFRLVNDVNGKDVSDPIARALATGAVVEIDDAAVLLAKDGTRRRIADSAAPIRGGKGELRGAVLVFHDITKVLEDARSLRRNRAFLDTVLESIPNMIFVKDAQDLAFVRLNRAGEKLLGQPREALIGRTDFAFFSAVEAKAFIARDREALRTKAMVDIPEEPITTPHGTRWLRTQKVPLLDENGEPEYLLGISEDITERREEAVLLRASIDAAQAANKELEAFSYSVAHDLRAPLRSIDGFSQALLDDYAAALDEQGRDYLHRVRNNARRMAELIDDLLGLARVSRTELRRSDVDVSALFEQAMLEAKKHWNEAAVVVVEPGLRAFADARLLRVLADNLASNALKFSSKKESPRVEVGKQGNDFFVRDNGAGFDSAGARNLFTAFQRFHRPTEYEGTGIGLATADRIVARHGGRMWAESKPGQGATFYFVLERGTPGAST